MKNEQTIMSSMQDWQDSLYGFNVAPPKCVCGANTAKLGIYGHAPWCELFIAPVPVSDSCECGGSSWHSVNCKYRKPEPEILESEDKKNRRIMKNAIDLLNKKSYLNNK